MVSIQKIVLQTNNKEVEMCNGICPLEWHSGPKTGDCSLAFFPDGWVCPPDIEEEIINNSENESVNDSRRIK